VNHKRICRIVQAYSLRLACHDLEQPDPAHDGKVIVMRSDSWWCSDGFEFTCWDDVVLGAFIIDAGAPRRLPASAAPTFAT
jgi:hypothetical protein